MKNIINRVKEIPTEQLPIVWCELNAWQFPVLLADIKPDWWEECNNSLKKIESSESMKFIESQITRPTLLMFWNDIYLNSDIEIRKQKVLSRLITTTTSKQAPPQ